MNRPSARCRPDVGLACVRHGDRFVCTYRYRQGLWIAVNYTDKVTEIPLAKGAEILSGEVKLPPGGVLVWRE